MRANICLHLARVSIETKVKTLKERRKKIGSTIQVFSKTLTNLVLKKDILREGLKLGLVQGQARDCCRGSGGLGFHPQTICQSLKVFCLRNFSKTLKNFSYESLRDTFYTGKPLPPTL